MRCAYVWLGLALAVSAERAFAQRYAGALRTRELAPPAAVEAVPARSVPVGYAVLPLRSLGADAEGARGLQERLCKALGARGAVFVGERALDVVLRDLRVRYTDSLSVADARAVREATGASFALAGVVFEFVRGKEPRLALCVRVIDLASGERVQSAFVSLRGQDFRGLLGLGAIEDVDELVERAVARVLESFGEHGGPLVRRSVVEGARARNERAEPVAADAGRAVNGKPSPVSEAARGRAASAPAGVGSTAAADGARVLPGESSPPGTVAQVGTASDPVPSAPSADAELAGAAPPPSGEEAPVESDPDVAQGLAPNVERVPARREPIERLALLPFVNRSTRTDAGTSFAELLAHAWFQETGVQVVETSELRSALVRARIRSLNEMDAATLKSIGTVLDARWFVLGSVDRFGEETVVRDQRYPEIEITLRLVDGRTGLVASSKSLRLRGDEGETLLRLGVEHDPMALASDAARELVLAMEGGS